MISFYTCLFHFWWCTWLFKEWQFVSIEGSLATRLYACMLVSECLFLHFIYWYFFVSLGPTSVTYGYFWRIWLNCERNIKISTSDVCTLEQSRWQIVNVWSLKMFRAGWTWWRSYFHNTTWIVDNFVSRSAWNMRCGKHARQKDVAHILLLFHGNRRRIIQTWYILCLECCIFTRVPGIPA